MGTILSRWFADEMASLPTLRPDGWAVMGFPLWGAKYLDRFEHYCLASMLAPENHAALRGRAALVLWARERGHQFIKYLLAPYDIELVVRTIPDELIALNKYQLLSVIERLLVQTAAKNGRGFTGTFPDCTYSSRYFASLEYLSRHHNAIAHSNLTAAHGRPVTERFNTFRKIDGSLVVPARELGDIGWRHLHDVKRGEVRDVTALPAYHFLFWRGDDYVRIHSPHCNAGWMSPDLCRRAPRDDAKALGGHTLDSAVPFFLGSRPYHVSLTDEMVVTDLYDGVLPARGEVTSHHWVPIYRAATLGKAAYLPYFSAPTMVPVHRQPGGLSSEEIARQVRAVTKLAAGSAR